jgi:hypothetical protein
VLGTARRLGLEELIDQAPDLVTAMAVMQVIAPDSKLAIACGLRDQTAASSLGEVLQLGSRDEGDLYAAIDYLHDRQDAIQDALAARHLASGTLVLYDVSSSASGGDLPAGRHRAPRGLGAWPAADRLRAADLPRRHPGHDRGVQGQHRRPGDCGRPGDQGQGPVRITKVVLVGDRGMLTAARLCEDVAPAHLDWITALRAPQVKKLVRGGELQLTLFDIPGPG